MICCVLITFSTKRQRSKLSFKCLWRMSPLCRVSRYAFRFSLALIWLLHFNILWNFVTTVICGRDQKDQQLITEWISAHHCPFFVALHHRAGFSLSRDLFRKKCGAADLIFPEKKLATFLVIIVCQFCSVTPIYLLQKNWRPLLVISVRFHVSTRLLDKYTSGCLQCPLVVVRLKYL